MQLSRPKHLLITLSSKLDSPWFWNADQEQVAGHIHPLQTQRCPEADLTTQTKDGLTSVKDPSMVEIYLYVCMLVCL